jgi:hypothetical protein
LFCGGWSVQLCDTLQTSNAQTVSNCFQSLLNIDTMIFDIDSFFHYLSKKSSHLMFCTSLDYFQEMKSKESAHFASIFSRDIGDDGVQNLTLMNGDGMAATVVHDLTHVKQWTEVTVSQIAESFAVLSGTSPKYGECVVLVQSSRAPELNVVNEHSFLQNQQVMIAFVDEDSTVSYYRVFEGLNMNAVPASEKTFGRMK